MFLNTINYACQFQFTSDRQLTRAQLRAIHAAVEAAFRQGPSDELLAAVQESVPMFVEADNFAGYGARYKAGATQDKLRSKKAA